MGLVEKSINNFMAFGHISSLSTATSFQNTGFKPGAIIVWNGTTSVPYFYMRCMAEDTAINLATGAGIGVNGLTPDNAGFEIGSNIGVVTNELYWIAFRESSI